MKRKHFISSTLCATVVSFFLFSCSSSDDVVNNNNEEQNAIENLLMANSEQTVDFDINYGSTNGKRITFDVYSENPQKNASAKPFMSAMTDENGEYKFARMIPGGIKEVFVVSDCAGVPTLLSEKITEGAVKLVSGSRAGSASEDTNSDSGTNNYIIKDYCCAIRPLSDMIDGIENNDVMKDMVIFTKSNFRIVNGDVTGVNDEVYIGSASNISKIIFTDFQLSLQSLLNNISVYSESAISRTKTRGVVHTTVKEIGYHIVESSRSNDNVNSNLTPSEVIRNLIYSKKQTLMDGGYLKLNTYVEFEPVSYSEFITTVPLAPYTPFIENN